MENYVGKYVEIREKDGLSATCMLVTEQEYFALDDERYDLFGIGFSYGKDGFNAATYLKKRTIDRWFEVEEITRKEFLKKHETAFRAIRAKLTKKTYKQAKKLKQ